MLTAAGCSSGPVFDVEPEILFMDVSPKQVSRSNPDDLFVITIHFQDGDGDLGDNTGEKVSNLFIRDTRDNIPDSVRTEAFSMPDLTPQTRKPSIQGTIDINVEVLPQLSKDFPPYVGPDAEDIYYDVWLVDRAGHQSNTVRTSAITITK